MATTLKGIIGNIQEFKPENEPFPAYMERVHLFFSANGVKADQQGRGGLGPWL